MTDGKANTIRARPRRIAGMTLPEILLAAGLGTTVVAVLSQAMELALRKSRDETSRHHAHQIAVSAEQLLRAAIPTAASAPCPRNSRRWYAVSDHKKDYWSRIFRGAAEVLPHDSAGAKAVHATGTDGGDRVAGHDVLVLRHVRVPVAVEQHNTGRGLFVLSNDAGVRRGDLALVCDGGTQALFQVTRVAQNGLHLFYRVDDTVRPGNCAGIFGAPDGCGENTLTFDGAVVMRYNAVAFFIGNGHHKGDLSLFRKDLLLRSSGDDVLAYMVGSEVLTGVRSLKAAVIIRRGRDNRHIARMSREDVAEGDTALGLAIELTTGSGASDTPDNNTLHHAFEVAL